MDLSTNNLGGNFKNLGMIGYIINLLPNNLLELNLNLDYNDIGEKVSNMEMLGECMK